MNTHETIKVSFYWSLFSNILFYYRILFLIIILLINSFILFSDPEFLQPVPRKFFFFGGWGAIPTYWKHGNCTIYKKQKYLTVEKMFIIKTKDIKIYLKFI